MVISAVTDIDRRQIPNPVTGLAGILAVLMAVAGLSVGVIEALSSALVVGLPLAALALVRPEGFGMGDAKLIGVMALFLGWGVWMPLLAGLGLATCFGIGMRLLGPRRDAPVGLPLAPFLAVASLPILSPILISAVPLLH